MSKWLVISIEWYLYFKFTDDFTAYDCGVNLGSALVRLEANSELAISWFGKNYMKLDTDKCHLVVSGTKYEQVSVKKGKGIIWESGNVKLLGVNLDNKSEFDEYVFIKNA